MAKSPRRPSKKISFDVDSTRSQAPVTPPKRRLRLGKWSRRALKAAALLLLAAIAFTAGSTLPRPQPADPFTHCTEAALIIRDNFRDVDAMYATWPASSEANDPMIRFSAVTTSYWLFRDADCSIEQLTALTNPSRFRSPETVQAWHALLEIAAEERSNTAPSDTPLPSEH